jgi:SagB-type dehydrogenase family enzyme
VIRSRRSVRAFTGKPVTLAELSTILFHCNGVTGQLDMPEGAGTATLGSCDSMELRSVASGGGLYPIDLYVVGIAIRGLEPGVYRYQPGLHALMPVGGAVAGPELHSMAQFGDIYLDQAAFLIAYVYKQFENARKYGEPALGFAYMEVGAIAHSIQLVCTAYGIGACDVGGFAKRRFEKMLKADGMSRHMIHLTVVGR